MIRRSASGLAALLLAGCASVPPPATVPSVDLARYAGQWHEIESFPSPFQRGCSATRAVYIPAPDGRIRVQNFCRRKGRLDSIEGTARVVPGSNNARLKVRFFWPFEGDYWILDLDRDYRWAAVGTPDRRFLWILSRTPELDPVVLGGIRRRLATQGYDVNRLQPTPH
ncbi:MAG: lipocalin family protein [Chthoniobacterales bacterium]|nr:lipocalin family protein [Chthoniobacterales bacterium]